MIIQEKPHYKLSLSYISCLNPTYIVPDIRLNSIADISSSDLKEMGISSLIFDVDNTICNYNGVSIDSRVEKNFRKLTKDFKSCILSNTNPERVSNLEEYFDISVLKTEFRKPSPEAFLKALDYLRTDPENTAMIGDRLFTDIAGAN